MTTLLRTSRAAAMLGMLIGAGVAPPATAQERPIAFTGATIHTMAGPQIENGTLVVHKGRIIAVGANAPIPAGAERRDARGMVV
ncbi:MAG TPA: hypothetical protein VEZ41_12810, partial [Allosphingosinicella sp.]|nr:hypothetical protein [Allosphingosinicella sp.]